MGHHLIEKDGRPAFQSDKHPELPVNRIRLSFADPDARFPLRYFAMLRRNSHGLNDELAADIITVLDDMDGKTPPTP